MGSIYLIRHGQASFGKDDYDNLSPLGMEQSAILGRHFNDRGLSFDVIYGGSMKRHQQTSDACLNEMTPEQTENNSLTALPEFNEYDHEHIVAVYKPEFENKTALANHLAEQPHPRKAFQEIFSTAMKRWASGNHDDEYQESWQQFQQRCHQGLDTVLQRAKPSQHIAVFTSGGPISATIQRLLDIPNSKALSLNWSMVNSSVTHCLYNESSVSLNYFNNYTHLQTEVQSPLVTYR